MARKRRWIRATTATVAVGFLAVGSYAALNEGHTTVSRFEPAPSTAPPRSSPTASMVADDMPDPTATIAGYLKARGAHAGIAVLDRVTGLAVAYNDGVRFGTASVVKLDILATLLWQRQRAHRSLTAAERDLATDMIIESDNDATDALWTRSAGQAVWRRRTGPSA